MYNIEFSYNLDKKSPNIEYTIEVINVEVLSKEQFIEEVLKSLEEVNHQISDIQELWLNDITMYGRIHHSADFHEKIRIFTRPNYSTMKQDLVEFISNYYTSIMQEFRYYKEVCETMIKDGLIIVSKDNIC